MSRLFLLSVCVATFLSSILMSDRILRAQPCTYAVTADSDASRRIHAKLRDETSLQFVQAPLEEVVKYIEDLHDMQIELDSRTLNHVGIGSDPPITSNLKGISLESGLRLMLKPLDLTFVIRDEVLLITTFESVLTTPRTTVFNVLGLTKEDKITLVEIERSVSQMLASQTPLEKKYKVDTPTVSTIGGLLVVTGHDEAVRRVDRLLYQLDVATNGEEKVNARCGTVTNKTPVVKLAPKQRPKPARPAQNPFSSPVQKDPFGGGKEQRSGDPFGS